MMPNSYSKSRANSSLAYRSENRNLSKNVSIINNNEIEKINQFKRRLSYRRDNEKIEKDRDIYRV